MDFQTLLLKEHSKAYKNHLADQIGNDPVLFGALWEIIRTGDPPVPQRGAWVLDECVTRYPSLMIPHLNSVVDHLQVPTHDAVKRALLKVLAQVDIPESLAGEVYSNCMDWTGNPQLAIAIRVFSMETAWQISRKYPELQDELALVIEAHLPQSSAGFKSRGKKILNKIKNAKYA